MTYQRNETPEPLAGATVEACITALVSALQQEKGWLHDYADSVVRDAIERKHLDQATIQDSLKVADLPPHPEPHSHTWSEQEKRCILAWGAELAARKAEPLAREQAGEMPEIAAIRAALDAGPTPGPWSTRGGVQWLHLVADVDTFGKLEHWRCIAAMDEDNDLRKEDAAYIVACNPEAITAILAALQAKDAEIARLKAVLVNARHALEEANEAGSGGPIQDTIWMPASISSAETLFDYLDAAMKGETA